MIPSTNQFAHQAYRTASIAVPPLQAMVMLFDGAILFLRKSMLATEQRRFEESHNHLLRATAILRGLGHNLDFGRGSALSERLYLTYSSLIVACHRSYGRPDANARYDRIIGSLGELRDAWKEVAATVARSGPRN
jgi:flagellar secretion chaperone FliS